jgi:hypothetical protein
VKEYEYRGTVTCTQDPCAYCGTPDDRPPARTHVVDGYEHSKVFETAAEALDFARGMAQTVYGGSVHRAGVQRRLVGGWGDFAEGDPPALDEFARAWVVPAEVAGQEIPVRIGSCVYSRFPGIFVYLVYGGLEAYGLTRQNTWYKYGEAFETPQAAYEALMRAPRR